MTETDKRTFQNKPVSADFHVRLDYYKDDLAGKQDLDKPRTLDFFARSRDVIADPINELIDRVPLSGGVNEDGHVILHNGLRVPITGPNAYYGEYSHILVVNKGVHEPLEEFVFQEVVNTLHESPVMLELGSYWAHYSMWLKARRPDARVIMVEPDANNLAVGQSNFSLNGLSGEFESGFVGHGHFEIDKFMHDTGLPRIDILHADIQGFELEMLEGAEQALADGRVDRVFISTHSNELHADCIEFLKRFGFHIIVASDYDSTTSWDGLIFAVRSSELSCLSRFTPCSREDANKLSHQQRRRYIDQVLSARQT